MYLKYDPRRELLRQLSASVRTRHQHSNLHLIYRRRLSHGYHTSSTHTPQVFSIFLFRSLSAAIKTIKTLTVIHFANENIAKKRLVLTHTHTHTSTAAGKLENNLALYLLLISHISKRLCMCVSPLKQRSTHICPLVPQCFKCSFAVRLSHFYKLGKCRKAITPW